MDDLVNKYKKELDNVNKSMWGQYAEALDLTIKHIKFNEFEDKIKIPCVYVVKKILLDNDIFEMVNITTLINEFIKYYEDEYEKYMNGFALITDQHYADLCFYDEFIKKHQQ